MTARRLAVRAAARALHSSWEGRIRRKRERQGIDPVVQVRAPLALAPIRGTPAKAVERHLWQRDDNHEKLIQAKTGEDRRADEAHLLIWVPCGEPHRNGAPAAARSSMIELGDIPKPDLKGIDAVWVGDPRGKQLQSRPPASARAPARRRWLEPLRVRLATQQTRHRPVAPRAGHAAPPRLFRVVSRSPAAA